MPNPQRDELTGVVENGDLAGGKILSGVVRELHVYGPLGTNWRKNDRGQ